MINIEAELYDKVESEIQKWNEEGIYVISFFVDSNAAYEYRGFENASMWTISYNTESDCDGAGLYDEERWNYAFWRQDEIPIISLEESDIYSEMLFDWYEENGITNIGEEDSYDVEATENANPGGEADVFREAMERNGFV